MEVLTLTTHVEITTQVRTPGGKWADLPMFRRSHCTSSAPASRVVVTRPLRFRQRQIVPLEQATEELVEHLAGP